MVVCEGVGSIVNLRLKDCFLFRLSLSLSVHEIRLSNLFLFSVFNVIVTKWVFNISQ